MSTYSSPPFPFFHFQKPHFILLLPITVVFLYCMTKILSSSITVLSRYPLRKHLGLSYSFIEIHIFLLTVSIHDVRIRPSDSETVPIWLWKLFWHICPSGDFITPSTRNRNNNIHSSRTSHVGKKCQVSASHSNNHTSAAEQRTVTSCEKYCGSELGIDCIAASLRFIFVWFSPWSICHYRNYTVSSSKIFSSSSSPASSLITAKSHGSSSTNYHGKTKLQLWFDHPIMFLILPRFYLNIQGVCMEIDKCYLAPIPPLSSTFVSSTGSQPDPRGDTFEEYPAALGPRFFHRNNQNESANDVDVKKEPQNRFVIEEDEIRYIPTFDQNNLIKSGIQDVIAFADKIMLLFEQRLCNLSGDRSTDKVVLSMNETKKDVRLSYQTSPSCSLADEQHTCSAYNESNKTCTELESIAAKRIDVSWKADLSHSFLKTLLNLIFSFLFVAVKDVSIGIIAVDSEKVLETNRRFTNISEACFQLATKPRQERTLTALSVDELFLSCTENSCQVSITTFVVDTHFPFIINGNELRFPSHCFRDYKSSHGENYNRIIKLDRVRLQVGDFANYILHLIIGRHASEQSTLNLSLHVRECFLNATLRNSQNLCCIFEDYIGTNSAYSVWEKWLMLRMHRPLSPAEKECYRKLYRLHRGFSSTEIDNEIAHGMNSLSLIMDLEARMTHDEIIYERIKGIESTGALLPLRNKISSASNPNVQACYRKEEGEQADNAPELNTASLYCFLSDDLKSTSVISVFLISLSRTCLEMSLDAYEGVFDSKHTNFNRHGPFVSHLYLDEVQLTIHDQPRVDLVTESTSTRIINEASIAKSSTEVSLLVSDCTLAPIVGLTVSNVSTPPYLPVLSRIDINTIEPLLRLDVRLETDHLHLSCYVRDVLILVTPAPTLFLLNFLLTLKSCNRYCNAMSGSNHFFPEETRQRVLASENISDGCHLMVACRLMNYQIMVLPTTIDVFYPEVMCLHGAYKSITYISKKDEESFAMESETISLSIYNVLCSDMEERRVTLKCLPLKPAMNLDTASLQVKARKDAEVSSGSHVQSLKYLPVIVEVTVGSIMLAGSSTIFSSILKAKKSLETLFNGAMKIHQHHNEDSIVRRGYTDVVVAASYDSYARQQRLQDCSQIYGTEEDRALLTLDRLDHRDEQNISTGNDCQTASQRFRLNSGSQKDLQSKFVSIGIVHFDDLHEFTSVEEMYRITGLFVEHGKFPPPTMWRDGNGIQLFWVLFNKECGYPEHQFNGEALPDVQRKLVKALGNYEFARYTWMILVAPKLQSSGFLVTNWQLDANNEYLKSIANDKLHSFNSQPATFDGSVNFYYDVFLTATINNCSLEFGNAFKIAQPLFQILSKRSRFFIACALSSFECLLQANDATSFMSAIQFPLSHENVNDSPRNLFSWELDIEINYFNKKTGFLETCVSRSKFFYNAYCITLGTKNKVDPDAQKSQIAIKMRCPRYIHVTISPSFFEAISSLTSTLYFTQGKDGLKNIFQNLQKNIVPTKGVESEVTRQDLIDALSVARSEGLRKAEVEDFIDSRLENAYISDREHYDLRRATEAIQKHMPLLISKVRNVFKVTVVNALGEPIKVCSMEKWLTKREDAELTQADYLLFERIEDGDCGHLEQTGSSHQTSFAILVSGYSVLLDVPLSPYMNGILPLQVLTTSSSQRRRRKIASYASGFHPMLAVMACEDVSDRVTINIRSTIVVDVQTPVDIQLFRLKEDQLHHISKGRNTDGVYQFDFRRKFLDSLLRLTLEGSTIVFQAYNVLPGTMLTIPLQIVTSSHLHAIHIRNIKCKIWRVPILIHEQFLHNPRRTEEIQNILTDCDIVVLKKRRNIITRGMASSKRYDEIRFGWETIIRVMPSFELVNALPCAIEVRTWQTGKGRECFASEDRVDDDFYSCEILESGSSLHLNGLDFEQELYMQLAQALEERDSSLAWTETVSVPLKLLHRNRACPSSLPIIMGNLGDESDFCLYVSIQKNGLIPRCVVYAPFLLVNKTGMKMAFKVSNRHGIIQDSGVGGLPLMFYCNPTRATADISRIYALPLERPSLCVLQQWWNESEYGKINIGNAVIVGGKCNWSNPVELDAIGRSTTLKSQGIIFSASVNSLAGVFHRSSLITLTPRYVFRNCLRSQVRVFAVLGTFHDAKILCRRLQVEDIQESEARPKLIDSLSSVDPKQSIALYQFRSISTASVKLHYFVCFNIVDSRMQNSSKWHLVDLESGSSCYYSDRHKNTSHLVMITEVHVRLSSSCTFISCHESSYAPMKIENRTQHCFIQLRQNDQDGVIFELKPMTFCMFTWDNPHGHKTLRVVAIKQEESRDECVEQVEDVSALEKQRLYSPRSRFIDPLKIGTCKTLPHPVYTACHNRIFVQVLVQSGIKTLSFNDSPRCLPPHSRLSDTNWRYQCAGIDVWIEGCTITLIDDYPHEIVSLNFKAFSILKSVGSIVVTATLRHFQIDAMSTRAKYPVILQPDHREVDRKVLTDLRPANFSSPEKYWLYQDTARTVPLVELTVAIVPQATMKLIWLEEVKIFLCPLRLRVELDYLLQIADLVLNSYPTSGNDARDITGVDIKELLTCPKYEESDRFQTYVQKLTINKTWLEMELDIGLIANGDVGLADGAFLIALDDLGTRTQSALQASLNKWLTKIAAGFAHASPTFRYEAVIEYDHFGSASDLGSSILHYYIIQTVLQAYKVLFSMHLIGDPSELIRQYKSGLVDLFAITSSEIAARGKHGIGKGALSFFQNIIGGTFIALGKTFGSVADILDSVTSTEFSSPLTRPTRISGTDSPLHLLEGLRQGFMYMGKSLTYGFTGLVGDPYRGIRKRTMTGFSRGLASGVGTLLMSPLVGAFGCAAKVSEGLGATTYYFDDEIRECRCRPERIVEWGVNFGPVSIAFVKGIAVRVHFISNCESFYTDHTRQSKDILDDHLTPLLEERKFIILTHHGKSTRTFVSNAGQPHLFSVKTSEKNENIKSAQFHTIFEETLIMRSELFQFSDEIKLSVWSRSPFIRGRRSILSAQCSLNLSDIFYFMGTYYSSNFEQIEKSMSVSITTRNETALSWSVAPAIQNFALFRPSSKMFTRKMKPKDTVASAIREELSALAKEREDALSSKFESDSSQSSYGDVGSIDELGYMTKNESKELLKSMQQLYGHISLSFYPLSS